MKIYCDYYYDRPFLEAWLNHYCHIPCIDEILIHSHQWTVEDTFYMLEIVARYIDNFDVKISVLPSQLRRPKGSKKNLQFMRVGEPNVKNRIEQFLQDATFIRGDVDEAVYGKSYVDTDGRLREFEEQAEEKKADLIGYLSYYTVCKNGVFVGQYCHPHCEHWRAYLRRFFHPFKWSGGQIHDHSVSVFNGKRWIKRIPVSGLSDPLEIPEPGIVVPLKTFHYQRLCRPSTESADFYPVKMSQIPEKKIQPRHYLEKLVVSE